MKIWNIVLTLVAVLMLASGAFAQASDADDLAKAAQNPLAAMVSLPLQTNYNSGYGDFDRTFFNLNVQPVVPFKGGKWDIISRTIIPINSLPMGEYDSAFGIGDANMTLFFTPAKAGSVTWGIGPILGLPTSSNPQVLGTQKWGLGPSGVIFISAGKWTLGGVVSNTWSIAGNPDRDSYSLFTGQYFINFNFGRGWAMGSAPILSANWKAESGDQWTIPWGLQIAKVTHFGHQPVNLLLGYYNNSEYPEGGAQRQVRFQVNFMWPVKAK